jgi:hypothetical protein
VTILTLSTSLPLGVGSGMGQRRFDLSGASDTTGDEQARLLGPPRWLLQLVQPANLTARHAGAWQALTLQMRGRINRLLAFDPVKRAPMGTLRGTLTLNGSVAKGATTMALNGGTGTILAGDLLQIGSGLGTSQLVMAVTDGSHSGITFEPPTRVAFSDGVAVTWDTPRTYFRMAGETSSWAYGPQGKVTTGMSFDLVEVFS